MHGHQIDRSLRRARSSDDCPPLAGRLGGVCPTTRLTVSSGVPVHQMIVRPLRGVLRAYAIRPYIGSMINDYPGVFVEAYRIHPSPCPATRLIVPSGVPVHQMIVRPLRGVLRAYAIRPYIGSMINDYPRGLCRGVSHTPPRYPTTECRRQRSRCPRDEVEGLIPGSSSDNNPPSPHSWCGSSTVCGRRGAPKVRR